MSERSDAVPRATSMTGPARVLLARGIPALIMGLATTFTGGHSPLFGLLAVGAWGVVGGALEGAAVIRTPLPARARSLELVRAGAVLVVGVLAVVLSASALAVVLVYLIGVGALVWGALDLGAGFVARGRTPLAREWILHGGISVLMGVITLIVPPGFVEAFPGAGGQPGVLTASTVVVGFFGAWGIVIGVLSVIAAVGQRSAAPEER